jgi:hypothetical protein
VSRDRKPAPLRHEHDTRRLIRQFVFGILWMSVWAALVAAATDTPIWIVMPAMLALVVGGGTVAVFWLARWAERDSRGGQFGIATLLLGTVYVAAFLACVRWTLVATRQALVIRHPNAELPANFEPTLTEFASAALASLLVLYISLPIFMGLLDSSMWLAVWLIKRLRS